MRKIVQLLLLVILMTGMQHYSQGQNIPANSPAGINGQLKVIGTKLCNQYDKPIQLRGMSTHGIQWFYNNCYANNKLAAFDALRNWGGDILRISMYVQEGGYETDPVGYTNKVKALIDVATARGMYALIDFHQLTPGDPNYNTARAKTFFTDIANAYKNYPNIIYDICNEPNGSSVTWAVIKNYADQVIPTIRAIDHDAVITVGTDGWATFGYSRTGNSNTYKDVVNNKLNYPNVMYSFHFYADSHRDAYLAVLDAASNELPVFVTEFGFQNSAGEGTNNRAMSEKYITLMRNKKISWCNWNFSDDHRSGAVWKQGTCSANSWGDGNLKEAGLWAKEFISTPADDFPTGTVNQPPSVSLTAPANGATFTAPASITITASASDSDGSIARVEFFNGSTKLGERTATPYSFAWNNVGAGTYSITARATDNQGATTTSAARTVTVNTSVVRGPYGGTAAAIPGRVEAERYDVGGQNLAYYDNTSGNSGNAFRTDDVDLEATTDTGGGHNLGWTAAGEWLEYTVNIATTGTYSIQARVAAISAGKSFRIEMGGSTIATINVPNTGGWQTWQTVTVNNVNLTAGQRIMRIHCITDGFNINYIQYNSSTPTNQAPTVSLTAPANGATYTAPANVTITASASDADGSVSKVEFFSGATKLGESTSSPYSYSWTGVAAGSYSITARATDNQGAVTTSAARSISVSNPGNQAPSVSLTAPANGATYTAPASITITASASDADGSVSKVEFFNGATKLGERTSTPYSYTWTGVAAGSYSITARATDNQGAVTTSAARSVTVNPANNNTCSSIAQYVENGGYVAGSIVKNSNNRYQCKPWPYSGWCNGAAWAYAPGTGAYWTDAWTLQGSCSAKIGNENATATSNEALLSNAPNPFHNTTTIAVNVEEAGEVSVSVYTKAGQLIQTITQGHLATGNHEFVWDASAFQADLYIVKCNTPNGVITRKIIKTE